MDSKIKKLLENWHRRVRLSQVAHYEAAKRVQWIHYVLGIQAVIIPTIVGTALFALLDKRISTSVLIILGILCIFSGIVSALQTFFRFDSCAELYLTAAGRYGTIRREIELHLLVSDLSEAKVKTVTERIVSQLDAIEQESPTVPHAVWRRVEEKLIKSDESYSRSLTKEESIIANIKSYGPLPLEFLAKTLGVTHSEVISIIESLKENRIVEIHEGKVSLTTGGP